MKHWDRAVPAEGIDLGVWMDAQANPEIVSAEQDELIVTFPCWNPRARGDPTPPEKAPYAGKLSFRDVRGYRRLNGELAPYRYVRGRFAHPECLFEVRLAQYDTRKSIDRDASWLPSIAREHDPGRWFHSLDAWDPKQAAPPELPADTHHYLVDGRDAFLEVLASRYEFERVLAGRPAGK